MVQLSNLQLSILKVLHLLLSLAQIISVIIKKNLLLHILEWRFALLDKHNNKWSSTDIEAIFKSQDMTILWEVDKWLCLCIIGCKTSQKKSMDGYEKGRLALK